MLNLRRLLLEGGTGGGQDRRRGWSVCAAKAGVGVFSEIDGLCKFKQKERGK